MGQRGKLEQRIIDALWDQGEATVREMHGRLGGRLAYTTVMTVLDRLHTKGEVVRCKDGLAWLYKAAVPRATAIGEQAARLLAEGKGETASVLMAFIDRTERVDPGVLDKLEEMIRQHRKRHGGGQ